ncbi:copper resistance protein NlpE N-terminal domain-containing protein [Phaeovulum veldkampii]|uniref:Copper resistance protein NlpE n=1 Tax=Phaeovulum veldkampii DSM 11550 TaxID=1185920 RepID=A0A2T4JKI3_9RHOB|nr:copper resistance protein NlpE N-terminal domain-containing protein [Phaeovulum veldkampii]PTE18405.1 hypothetical protein C5F46_04415 [Phaeovulum veldkampii DSM 11550]
MRRLLAICSLLLPLFAVPAGAEEPGQGAHGLRLPASFTGTLPCADCEGIRHHLDLWPDQSFALRLEWLGGARRRCATIWGIGMWTRRGVR